MIRIPLFKEPGLTEFLGRMIEERERGDSTKLSKTSANHSVLLFSPSKKVYEIKVDDAGVISATLVSG